MRAALLLLAGLTAGTVIGYHTAARLGRWALGYQIVEPDWREQMLREVREG